MNDICEKGYRYSCKVLLMCLIKISLELFLYKMENYNTMKQSIYFSFPSVNYTIYDYGSILHFQMQQIQVYRAHIKYLFWTGLQENKYQPLRLRYSFFNFWYIGVIIFAQQFLYMAKIGYLSTSSMIQKIKTLLTYGNLIHCNYSTKNS